MVYITVKQSPQYHQMSLEELLFGEMDARSQMPINPNLTNTRTYAVDSVSEKFTKRIDVDKLIAKLERFNEETKELRDKPRHDLYYEFHIPKKSGGLRKIDAPQPELKDALYHLKTIFEEDFFALYHTSAYAYIRKRSILDCLKKHQQNESRWFCKLDLSNFFGSTTLEFVMNMLSTIFPFSEVVRHPAGKQALSDALSLAFLDGGLPQGTPFSPIITNIMMIPIDFTIANALRDYKWVNKKGEEVQQRFVYTRYADDFQVSSKYDFEYKVIEKLIVDTLSSFDAPFKLNESKTRYGSSAGRNWNLGLMLNGNNEITVGHQKKRQFQAMLSSYVMDKKNGRDWDKSDIQTMDGYRNYYHMVEPDTIDKIIEHLSKKFDVDIIKMMKDDLRA